MPPPPDPRRLRTFSPRLWITTAVVAVVGAVVVGAIRQWATASDAKSKGRAREHDDDDDDEQNIEPTESTSSSTYTSSRTLLPTLKDYKGTLALLLPSAPTSPLLLLLSKLTTPTNPTDVPSTIYLLYPIPKSTTLPPHTPTPPPPPPRSSSSSSSSSILGRQTHCLPYTNPTSTIHMCKALNTDLILFLSPSEQGSTPSKLLVSSLSTSFQQLEMGLQGFGEKNWSKSIWTIHGGVEGLGRLFGF